MKLLSFSDLCVRWNYTRQNIHRLAKNSDFPEPIATVSLGKIKIYSEESILKYEKNKSWLFDDYVRKSRINLFWLWSLAKTNPELKEKLVDMKKNQN